MKTQIYSLLIFTALLITNSSCQSDNSGNTTNTNNTNNTTINGDTSKNKNDITEAIKTVGGLIEDGIEAKRKKDSLRIANKSPIWVYQIGLQCDDKDIIIQKYDKLKDINHIYIFKKSKHEYYLIKDDGVDTEEQLLASQDSIKKIIASISSDRLFPKNLALECSAKKGLRESDPIKGVECHVCK